MDIPVHNQILWHACRSANKRLGKNENAKDAPLLYFPSFFRGSWCNDTNQVSEMLGGKQFPQQFFQTLWKVDKEEIFNEIESYAGQNLRDAMDSPAVFDPSYDFLYDVGIYTPSDHLDIPGNVPSEPSTVQTLLTEVVYDGIYKKAATRLYSAFGTGERTKPAELSGVGRALHTIADYFGHTNHVELLLWHLDRRTGTNLSLPAPLRANLNSALGFLDPQADIHRKSPIPKNNSRVYFPHGQTPEETLVTSGLFSELDTAWSILGMYRRTLLGQSASTYNGDTMMSLVFGLVDFPRKNMVKFLLETYEDFGSVIDDIGQTARSVVRKIIKKELKKAFPEQAGTIDTAANLMESYNDSDAKDWATAGRISYLQQTIELTLLKKFSSGENKPQPNHTLLNKDYLPHSQSDIVLFNLACWLATTVSAEILEAYFSGRDYKWVKVNVLEKYVTHPTNYSDVALAKINRHLRDMYVANWRQVPFDME